MFEKLVHQFGFEASNDVLIFIMYYTHVIQISCDGPKFFLFVLEFIFYYSTDCLDYIEAFLFSKVLNHTMTPQCYLLIGRST